MSVHCQPPFVAEAIWNIRLFYLQFTRQSGDFIFYPMIIYRMVIVEGCCTKLQLLICYIYNHWLTQKYGEFWLVRYNGLVWSNIAVPFFYHPIYMIIEPHPESGSFVILSKMSKINSDWEATICWQLTMDKLMILMILMIMIMISNDQCHSMILSTLMMIRKLYRFCSWHWPRFLHLLHYLVHATYDDATDNADMIPRLIIFAKTTVLLITPQTVIIFRKT